MINISVAQLSPPDKDGWLTKQGGSIKTWKKRWFVLKGQQVYYFKSNKDNVVTGVIDLEPDSFVKEEPAAKKKKNMFSVGTKKRIFFIAAETPEDMTSWIEAIKTAIKPAPTAVAVAQPVGGTGAGAGTGGERGGGGNGPQPGTRDNTPPPQTAGFVAPVATQPTSTGSRSRMQAARSVVPFLHDDENNNKVLEFWVIWTESMPQDNNNGNIEFKVATSADMQKLQWRVAGPQNVFIQKMVDFFWNVGAPETEIDRLNDVGALINPVKVFPSLDPRLVLGLICPLAVVWTVAGIFPWTLPSS